MRTLFLSMDSVLRPLSAKFGYVEAVQWIGQLSADLAAHPDVQVVLNRTSDESFAVSAMEVLLAALGNQWKDICGPAELNGPVLAFVIEHQEIGDFVVIGSKPAELDGPLRQHVVACDVPLGADDPALVECRAWLAGCARPRNIPRAATEGLQTAAERLRTLFPPRPTHLIATVSLVLPEFELVYLEAGEFSLCIGERTPGVDWRVLKLGQQVECFMQSERVNRVIRARLLSAPAPPSSDEGTAS